MHSLTATLLPKDIQMEIIDDFSDDLVMLQYLKGAPVNFTGAHLPHFPKQWLHHMDLVHQAENNFDISVPPNDLQNLGVTNITTLNKGQHRHGTISGFWRTVRWAARQFPMAPAVVFLEGDLMFSKSWFAQLHYAANDLSTLRSPNGKPMGILTNYTKYGQLAPAMTTGCMPSLASSNIDSDSLTPLRPPWCSPQDDTFGAWRWNLNYVPQSQVFWMTRDCVEALAATPEPQDYHGMDIKNAEGGDRWAVETARAAGFEVASVDPSRVQHTGVQGPKDTGTPRMAFNFQGPVALDEMATMLLSAAPPNVSRSTIKEKLEIGSDQSENTLRAKSKKFQYSVFRSSLP
jgi:hypothetical protein